MVWNWLQIPEQEAFAFLDAVRETENAILFEPSVCEVHKHALPFYDGYDLIRIVNKYSPPFVLLDYISNGENHFYLDGSDFSLQTICARGSTSLDTDNILTYIDFYLSYVYERGNSLVYIRDPQKTGFKGADAMGLHFQALQQHQSAQAKWRKKDAVFEIKTPLLYQEKSVNGVIHVDKGGVIAIQEPIKVKFLDNPQSHDTIKLAHPRTDSVLEQCKTLLSKTETGAYYLQLADEKKIDIQVIASPDIRAIATNLPMIYLFMPAAQYTADFDTALVLAGALHDALQISGGYKRPSIDEEANLAFDIHHDKNLKSFVGICKIVEEFEALNIGEAKASLNRLGLQSIYAGYKHDVDGRALFDTYIESLIEQGHIIES